MKSSLHKETSNIFFFFFYPIKRALGVVEEGRCSRVNQGSSPTTKWPRRKLFLIVANRWASNKSHLQIYQLNSNLLWVSTQKNRCTILLLNAIITQHCRLQNRCKVNKAGPKSTFQKNFLLSFSLPFFPSRQIYYCQTKSRVKPNRENPNKWSWAQTEYF